MKENLKPYAYKQSELLGSEKEVGSESQEIGGDSIQDLHRTSHPHFPDDGVLFVERADELR